MDSLKKQKGFTVVELLIVVVVIAILIILIIVTFAGVQKKARDAQRQDNITTVDVYLEAYFAQNGYYPTVVDLRSSSFLRANMKGLDPQKLVDPKGDMITGNAPTHGTYKYSYQATGCNNTVASSSTNQCTAFTLTAELENGGTSVKSNNT